MQPYTVPSGGDYSIHKGAAVHMNGTLACAVQSCSFDQLGGNAVALSDWNRNATIGGNEMKRLGENGIVLSGTTDFVDGVSNVNQPRPVQTIASWSLRRPLLTPSVHAW